MTAKPNNETTAKKARKFNGEDYKCLPRWKNATKTQWNDWKWQMANAVRDVESLKETLPISQEQEDGVRKALERFRMAITPYYASLIDPSDPNDPVLLQAVPSANEAIIRPTDMRDPLGEDVDSPVHGLTHRYPDRTLLLITQVCAMYCRHCTRRRSVGESDAALNRDAIKKEIEYIKSAKKVRDVLISGGDPFTMSDDFLDWILKEVRAIKHVEIIRIGSRTPVVLPMRITKNLTNILKKYHPLYLNTHFNHPKEITPMAEEACARLADAGVPLGNQTVLLNGVNDCPHVMKALMTGLLKIRVKPYYIYQCDQSEGIGHFRTPISVGMQIMESLRGHITGMGVPTFVIDCPGGGGKVPVMPNYVVTMSPNSVVLRNYEGLLCKYSVELDYKPSCGTRSLCRDEKYAVTEGPAKMMLDDSVILEPFMERKIRLAKIQKEKNKA